MQPPKPMHVQGEERHIDDPRIRHERTDISLTGVVAFIIALAFCGIVIFVVLWGVFHFANNYIAKQDQQEMRSPWVQRSESEIEAQAQKLRTPRNKSAEPGSMESGDSQSRVRVTRFPQPRLQSDDARDLSLQREAENVYLNEYLVLDKNSGRVNIPITQAMEAVVKKGLPASQPVPGTPLPPAAETTGVTRPSIESSHAKSAGGTSIPK
ncbi:MAG TPA: hypothetical protein VG498_17420 [Terriglobales bacterium]|nr:hypothetical protein [Terriglobales bacterium]